jgi:hypothetical protein
MKKALALLTFVFAFGAGAWAQEAKISLDTNKISIGEPAKLTIRFTYRADRPDQLPAWPQWGDTLKGGIEVMDITKIDTLVADKNDPYLFTQQRILTLTHWEGGFFPIEPVAFATEGGIVESNALLLEVVMPEVDIEADIRDIKGPLDADLSFWEWLILYWYYIAAGLALGGVAAFFIFGKKPEQPATAEAEESVPAISPEEAALERLRALLERKLWLQGAVKEHHSEVSEIIRWYMEQRMKFNAPELTTDEILRELQLRREDEHGLSNISKVLGLTDLVKFAKANPLLHENEEVVRLSIAYIESRKPLES